MSVAAVHLGDSRAARFWRATVGAKIVMAVSGGVMFMFILGHLLGNLQVFMGADRFNGYARFLRIEPALLWGVRLFLLLMVGLHFAAAVKLALLNKRTSRPVGYVMKRNIGSTYASRTMYLSGPLIAVFAIYHLMQFTWGVGGTPAEAGNAYGNLIRGFQVPAIAVGYVVALALLMMHLYHGVWSMFQTLGVSHPRYTPLLRTFAKLIATLVFLGFSSIPMAVLTGVIS